MAVIYVVEDDVNIQEIEAIALKNSGHTVYTFDDASHFYRRLEEKMPDLAIVDIMLPDDDGYEIVRKVRNNPSTKKLPVIMVTAKTSEIDMVRGLDIGADDYIKKPFSVIEFITRVKAVLRRTMEQTENKFMTIGDIFLDDERHVAYVSNEPVELTYKEYELLKLFLMNPELVLSRDVIMERVWGFDYEGNTRTVDVHIKTLRQKLGESGSLIRTVRNVGYKLSGQEG